MRVIVSIVGAAVLVCATAAGCGSDTPMVSSADLQADITQRLDTAGQTPQSVTCQADLEGVVGKTTLCEVVLSETNAIEPIVEVTEVDGTTVSYEMTPALSKEQLERSVGNLITESAGEEATEVTCETGLRGEEGTEANCTMELAGAPLETIVTVTTVDGLLMNFDVNQV